MKTQYIWIASIITALIIVLGNHPLLQSNIMNIPYNASDANLKSIQSGDSNTPGIAQDGRTILNNAVMFVIEWLQTIFGIVATYFLINMAFKLLSSEDDQDLTKTKDYLLYSSVFLIGSFLFEPFIRNVLFGGGTATGLTPGSALYNPGISTVFGISELEGITMFIKTILGVAVVFMIIKTALQTIASASEENAGEIQKKNITWILIGIVVMLFNEIFIYSGIYGSVEVNGLEVITQQSATTIINEISGVYAYVFSFLGFIAFVAIMYGAYLTIFTQSDAGKKIILNVIIGFIVIFLSYTLTQTFITWNY